MAPPRLTKHKYLIVGGDYAGPKSIEYWSYQGVPLFGPPAPDNAPLPGNEGHSDDENMAAQYNDPLTRTTYIIDTLRKSKNATVWDVLEENNELKRLIVFKQRRDAAGHIIPIGLRTSKPQQTAAIAAHICLDAVNRHDCINCAGVKGRGPFDKCISFGDNQFRGACSCCTYNSVGISCDFHVKNKGTRYAQMTDHEAKEYDAKHASQPDLPLLTSDMMETAPLHQNV
ncbi:hypothetical protein GGR50DRAFT_691657 [Xylaria sp. CBS 124048]|nr:hypothetical protein GGR50DRAFT_691657 [Xylaria sp. CBS 124048]